MENKELVSVVIPCYNAEKYLHECLGALLNQTYPNLEVIIVNDGSIDESEKIIDEFIPKFEEKGKKLIKLNQENGGQAAAVNNGLKYVTGKYLMWQDADDYYELDAVEKLYNFLQEHPEYDFARGNVAFRNENEMDKIDHMGKSKYPDETNIFEFYMFDIDAYCFPGIFMARMEHFDRCIKNREIYKSRGGQNWQLILPMAYNGKCGYFDTLIYNYRIVATSHSHSVKKKEDLLKRCDVHQDILFTVLSGIDNLPEEEFEKYKLRIIDRYVKTKERILNGEII